MGAFGERLERERVPSWEAEYVNYAALKAMAAASSASALSSEQDRVQAFLVALLTQLQRCNAFVSEREGELAAEWPALAAELHEHAGGGGGSGGAAEAEAASLLKSHVRRTCRAPPGRCAAVARVAAADGASLLPRFVAALDRGQSLRHYVALNFLAFTKAIGRFEKKTALVVAPLFMPHLQASKFVNSPKLALLLTEIECAAQGWLVDAEAQTAGEVREDFTCAICLDVLSSPVVLNCAHRFCWHCAAAASARAETSQWSCPICRKAHTLTGESLRIHEPLRQFIDQHLEGAPAEPAARAPDQRAPDPPPRAAPPAAPQAEPARRVKSRRPDPSAITDTLTVASGRLISRGDGYGSRARAVAKRKGGAAASGQKQAKRCDARAAGGPGQPPASPNLVRGAQVTQLLAENVALAERLTRSTELLDAANATIRQHETLLLALGHDPSANPTQPGAGAVPELPGFDALDTELSAFDTQTSFFWSN